MKTQTVAVGKSEIMFQASPVEKVGIYVPGGRASYPSTVVMTATLARIAGVRDIICVLRLGLQAYLMRLH